MTPVEPSPLLPGVTSRKGQGPSFPPAGAVLFSKRLHPAIRTWIDGGCVLLKPLPLLTASLAPRWRGRSSNEGGRNEMGQRTATICRERTAKNIARTYCTDFARNRTPFHALRASANKRRREPIQKASDFMEDSGGRTRDRTLDLSRVKGTLSR